MDHCEPLSQEEVENIINTSPCKSCDIDPILTTLLKEILPSVITIFTEIINKSLISGIFPESLKEVLVKLLLKKANLNLIEKITDKYLILSSLENPLKEQPQNNSLDTSLIITLLYHISQPISPVTPLKQHYLK